MGLPAPEFREMGEFVVTFRKSPALSAPQPQPQFGKTLWDEDEQMQHTLPKQRMPDEQESGLIQAVRYVNEHGFITNKIYRELTGVSDRTASRDLETLVERGHLKGVGKKEHGGMSCRSDAGVQSSSLHATLTAKLTAKPIDNRRH